MAFKANRYSLFAGLLVTFGWSLAWSEKPKPAIELLTFGRSCENSTDTLRRSTYFDLNQDGFVEEWEMTSTLGRTNTEKNFLSLVRAAESCDGDGASTTLIQMIHDHENHLKTILLPLYPASGTHEFDRETQKALAQKMTLALVPYLSTELSFSNQGYIQAHVLRFLNKSTFDEFVVYLSDAIQDDIQIQLTEGRSSFVSDEQYANSMTMEATQPRAVFRLERMFDLDIRADRWPSADEITTIGDVLTRLYRVRPKDVQKLDVVSFWAADVRVKGETHSQSGYIQFIGAFGRPLEKCGDHTSEYSREVQQVFCDPDQYNYLLHVFAHELGHAVMIENDPTVSAVYGKAAENTIDKPHPSTINEWFAEDYRTYVVSNGTSIAELWMSGRRHDWLDPVKAGRLLPHEDIPDVLLENTEGRLNYFQTYFPLRSVK